MEHHVKITACYDFELSDSGTYFGGNYFGDTWYGDSYSGTDQSEIPGLTYYDTLQAIQVWWAGQRALQALASDRKLWHLEAPEDTALPYLTYFLVSETPETWTTGYAFMRSSVQFNCHASTDFAARSNAMQLATAAIAAFSGLVIYGQTAIHSLPENFAVEIGDGLGPKGQDCWIAHFTLDIPWVKS